MKNNALRKELLTAPEKEQENREPVRRPEEGKGFRPRSAGPPHLNNGHADQALRMYTEEEVSEILQVSLSQLRKWRMKKNHANGYGPPFKKIGRLVRYPRQSLQAYINGEDQDHVTQE
jgi:outer membrane biosynthesis protein TonB